MDEWAQKKRQRKSKFGDIQSIDEDTEQKNLKRSRSLPNDMTVTDSSVAQSLDDSFLLPVEDIVRFPLPGYVAPTSITFSPDDSFVTFLFSPDSSSNKKVFAFDIKTCKQELIFSPPDGGKERGFGVTRYEWVKRSTKRKSIMVPHPARIYIQDFLGSTPELKLSSKPSSPIMDPHISPDGSMLAFVKDGELHVMNLTYNEVRQLTVGANKNILHGIAEYIAEEEMNRKNGYWWSLDSKYIAYTRVDTSKIPPFRIMHLGKSSVGSDAQEDHAYSFAGTSNAIVCLGVVSVHGGPITWMDLLCGESEEEEYLARVCWMHGNVLIAQILNRLHTKLKIVKFDIKTGQRKLLLVEENDSWVNLHDCFTPLDKSISKHSGGFIWASEKSGFRHLYLHDVDGTCLRPITEGDWMVGDISGVDEAAGLVYFTGTHDGPLENHLYCTKLNTAGNLPLEPVVRLTQGKGKHDVVLDHRMGSFIDVHDSLDSPPRVSLCSLKDGSFILPIFEQTRSIPRMIQRFHLEPPEIVELHASDGTLLYGALYRPNEVIFGPPSYKTMIIMYGGPSVQLVCDSWRNTVDMRAQYLRNRGILVWKLDNRGTARRGLKFEAVLKYKVGHIDADDQLVGAKWLIRQGLARAGEIGLYGWSYGGFLSAMSLAQFPDIYGCAISGAPVTAWDGYDTFYTEKYMGLPSRDPEVYEQSSVMHHIDKMTGKLLLVHGMIDENVHFRHTARLVNALISAGKMYELLIFPNERHRRQHRHRIYMEERIWEFIKRNL